jgi:hypothetical protein
MRLAREKSFQWISALKVRLSVISALSLFAMILGLGYMHYHDTRVMWRPFTHSVLPKGPFEDLQTITFSIDCQRAGRDPYTSSCDPLERPLNYPPAWLLLGHLGVSGSRNGVLGAILCGLMAVAMIMLFPTRKLFSGACVFVAVFSRPIVLALERANNDLVIFSLLVIVCAVAPLLKSRMRAWFLTIGVIVLTCLKIYPIVASVALLKSRRTILPAVGAFVVSGLAFGLTSGRHITAAFRGTPVMVGSSFGIIPFMVASGHLVHRDLTTWATDNRVSDGLLALLLLVVGVAIGLAFRSIVEQVLPPLGDRSFRGLMAVSCAAIYLFIVGGASFNYRLIFLFGTLALLLESYDRGTARVAPFAAFIMFYIELPGRFTAIHEVCDVLVYLWFSAWITAFVLSALTSADTERTPDTLPVTISQSLTTV